MRYIELEYRNHTFFLREETVSELAPSLKAGTTPLAQDFLFLKQMSEIVLHGNEVIKCRTDARQMARTFLAMQTDYETLPN